MSLLKDVHGMKMLQKSIKTIFPDLFISVDSMKAGKLVVTERPFTPKPRERHLYPARGGMAGRPQSGSINLQLIEEESGGSSR